jgi:hypothetical protein
MSKRSRGDPLPDVGDHPMLSFQQTNRKTSSEALVRRASELWGEPFTGFTIHDVVHAKGSPLEALLYAHLFWPEFVTLDGMTFLPFVIEDEADQARVRERRAALPDDRSVEEEFNYVEVAALFGRRRGETSVEEDALLARFLAEMWAAKLRVDFPSKTFRVRMIEASGDEEAAVTLYEER